MDQSSFPSQAVALETLLERQRAAFLADPMPSVAARRGWLKALRQVLVDQQHVLTSAVSRDFGNRSVDETLFAELLPCLQSIDHVSRHLPRWMRSEEHTSELQS